MSEARDPLTVRFGSGPEGLRLAVQTPPPGAASFSASYVGPAGWGFDPEGREGTARLVSEIAASAAGSRDRVALARYLDELGATLSHQVAPESGEFTVWGPAAEADRLLGVLADVVLRPRFDRSDVARARRRLLERQLREAAQPAQRAERELWRTVFPAGHPYRLSGLGTARSVDRAYRGALLRFHRSHHTGDGGLLIVTGPGRVGPVEAKVRRLFRTIPSGPAPRLAVPSLRAPPARDRSVDLPGRAQLEVRIGGASIARSAPEYSAAALANEVLGGRPLLSRLFQRVREQGGLAYHASSDLHAMRFGGEWVVQAGTAPQHGARVVALLTEELDRLRSTPVKASELKVIRESVIGETPLALESTAEAHELAVEVAYHGLPEDFWRTWPALLRALRPADLRRAAESAFSNAGAVTVRAGPLGAPAP